MKRSPLKRKSRTEVAKCKDRIQKLLTKMVRIRDKGCVMRHYPTGKCAGYTAADHIITRARVATYGDTRNVICLCNRHHIYWKPQNPTLYSRFVKDYMGDKYEWIERAEMDQESYTFGIYEWNKVEAILKQDLKELEEEKDDQVPDVPEEPEAKLTIET